MPNLIVSLDCISRQRVLSYLTDDELYQFCYLSDEINQMCRNEYVLFRDRLEQDYPEYQELLDFSKSIQLDLLAGPVTRSCDFGLQDINITPDNAYYRWINSYLFRLNMKPQMVYYAIRSDDLLTIIRLQLSKEGLVCRSMVPYACLYGKLNIVKYFQYKHNFIHTDAPIIQSCLNNACCGGNLEVIAYLVDTFEINIETFSRRYFYPLRVACQHGHLHVAEYLIDKFSLNDTDIRTFNNLIFCLTCLHSHLEVSKYLVARFHLFESYEEMHNTINGILLSRDISPLMREWLHELLI